ncbi:MAG: hypothetical protein ACTSUE_18105 [Promethearchaeota archaeon]
MTLTCVNASSANQNNSTTASISSELTVEEKKHVIEEELLSQNSNFDSDDTRTDRTYYTTSLIVRIHPEWVPLIVHKDLVVSTLEEEFKLHFSPIQIQHARYTITNVRFDLDFDTVLHVDQDKVVGLFSNPDEPLLVEQIVGYTTKMYTITIVVMAIYLVLLHIVTAILVYKLYSVYGRYTPVQKEESGGFLTWIIEEMQH